MADRTGCTDRWVAMMVMVMVMTAVTPTAVTAKTRRTRATTGGCGESGSVVRGWEPGPTMRCAGMVLSINDQPPDSCLLLSLRRRPDSGCTRREAPIQNMQGSGIHRPRLGNCLAADLTRGGGARCYAMPSSGGAGWLACCSPLEPRPPSLYLQLPTTTTARAAETVPLSLSQVLFLHARSRVV
jgi:hypothetical protein